MREKTQVNSVAAGHTRWILALFAGVLGGFLLAVCLNLLPLTAAQPEAEKQAVPVEQALEGSFVQVAREAGPAVVSISTERTEILGASPRSFNFFGDEEFEQFFGQFFRDFFGEIPEREYKQKGMGSGFIIDEDGYILTNQHVVQDADKITVTLPDGRNFAAELKGSDMRSDLAIIKIKAEHLPVLKLGNSDALQIGQWAIALGNPYGFAVGSAEPTVTVGIISALNRSLPQMYQSRNYTDLIQTDAAINPGNSGGPLVNIKGEAIGINVAIFTPSGGNVGIGFAIPINDAKQILNRLISGEKVLYGWVGLSVQDMDEQLARYFGIADRQGALVMKVLPGGPAEKAGFKEGDVLKKFAGQPCVDVKSLLREINKIKVGDVVDVEVIREKRKQILNVQVGERPGEIKESEPKAQAQEVSWRCIEAREITPETSRRYNLGGTEGVVVSRVAANSPAAQAGIVPGDVLVAVNRELIKNLEDYRRVVAAVQGDALVRTERGFVVIKE